jgi:hypothetical protein
MKAQFSGLMPAAAFRTPALNRAVKKSSSPRVAISASHIVSKLWERFSALGFQADFFRALSSEMFPDKIGQILMTRACAVRARWAGQDSVTKTASRRFSCTVIPGPRGPF